ncbi:MAG TPA: hypothetical protein VGP02_08580 [Mycobacteriales bacterium]|nr:hypothetical protein [Mycobacteriales bacterium]
MRPLLAVLAVPVLLLGTAVPAAASPAESLRILAVGRVEDPSLTLVAGGAITGIGALTAESVAYRPADGTYHETDRAAFGPGDLVLSADGAFDVWPFTLDPRTCTRHGSLTGTWTITAGTGDYAGATGHGTLSGRFVTYAARGPTGCDETAIRGFVAGSMAGTVIRRT